MTGAQRILILAAFVMAASANPAARAEEHMVFAQPNNTFEPSELTIEEGDTVTWSNAGGFHNVRADDDTFRCADGCDATGGDGSPSTDMWSFSLVFTDVGLIPYYCEVHGAPNGVGMSGVVEVLEGPLFADGFESGDTSAWSASTP